MKLLKILGATMALGAVVAFVGINPAEAERGGNGNGKGGKNINAIVEYSEPAECGNGVGVVLSEIEVGIDTSQCFTYDLVITVPRNATVFDETPTTFDLSIDGEDCAYGECDDGVEDGLPDGWRVVQTGGDAICMVWASQPDSVIGPNPPPQEPEFIIVQSTGGGNGIAECTVTVWVETVLHNKSDCSGGDSEVCGDGDDELVYRPASCHVLKEGVEAAPIRDGDGQPVVDTFDLHTVKAFNAAGEPWLMTTINGNDVYVMSEVLVAFDGDNDGYPACIDPDDTNEFIP